MSKHKTVKIQQLNVWEVVYVSSNAILNLSDHTHDAVF